MSTAEPCLDKRIGKMFKGSFLILLTLLANNAESAEILGIFSSPKVENFKLGSRLMKELAGKGHKVTVVSHFPQNSSNDHYIDFPLEFSKYLLDDFQHPVNEQETSLIGSLIHHHDSALFFSEVLLSDNNFQVLLQSSKKFDLVILEYSMNDALIGLGQKFNAPVVLLSPQPSSTSENYIFANPSPVAYIPNMFSGYTGFMKFWQRARNLFMNSFVNFYRRIVVIPQQRAVLKQWMNGIELDDAMKNVSLILLNSLPGITEPVPHMPNMIEVGGLHIEKDAEVPRDIVKFLDEANEGVILHTGYANREQTEIYVKTFARLSMKVLWKSDFTYNDLEDITCSGCSVPDNVKLVSSLPQENVLAHKNVKAFITNGDLFDLIDAAYFGVPVVGIPMSMVQETNMALAVENKYAVELSNDDLSEETIIRAIDEVVLNPQYKDNAEMKSAIIKDQETKPLDRATYWVEYVIRHNGAKHLQSPGVFLKWCQRSMIDIIIVLAIIDIILFLMFYYIFKHIIHHIAKLYKKKKSDKYVKLIE